MLGSTRTTGPADPTACTPRDPPLMSPVHLNCAKQAAPQGRFERAQREQTRSRRYASRKQSKVDALEVEVKNTAPSKDNPQPTAYLSPNTPHFLPAELYLISQR